MYDQAAAAACIRALLTGQPPNGAPPEAFGEWRDLVEVLNAAYAAGGTAKVRETFNDQVRRTPALVDLVSADQPMSDPWPTLGSAALYGLAGDLVRAIEPHTKADPAALLLNILTAFGNMVGDGPHLRVEFSKHPLRLFVALVGETAKARKGQSWSTPRYVFASIDEGWAKERVTSGLSSGEGLIYHVRDRRIEKQPMKVKGKVVGYQDVIVDHGEEDKRLLIVEEELAQALKVMAREGNILSPVLRQAWDTGDLHPLTKTNPIRATGAHVSVVGHITRDELLRHLDSTEQANGFANRFLWALVRRSKEIPSPTGVPNAVLNPLIVRLKESIDAATKIKEMKRDEGAEGLWAEIYHDLSQGRPGMLGAITARAEAQVMRLACVYAALDRSAIVQRAHLKAALGVWQHCEASARLVFGDSPGDPVADEILRLLRNAPDGLTRTDINNLFGRHKRGEQLTQAFSILLQRGLIRRAARDTEGRTAEVWFAVAGAKEARKAN